MVEEYSRAEHMRLMRAAKARGLNLRKSSARILSSTNVGLYQLQDSDGRVIAGAMFDATLKSLTPMIFAAPLCVKVANDGRASA